MKHFLLILNLVLFAFSGQSQTCGQLLSSGVTPTNPTSTQDCWLKLSAWCNVGYYLENYDMNFVSNTLTVNAYYCEGLTQAITITNDSIPLGQLAPGTYVYFVNVFSSAPGCQGYVQTDQASGTWQVINSTAELLSLSSDQVMIYPNPAHHEFIIGNASSQTDYVELYDLKGTCVLRQHLIDQIVHTDERIEPGMYFLSLFSNNQLLTTQRIEID